MRLLGNLALSSEESVLADLNEEGAVELLVLLAVSWDETVQCEATIALQHLAAKPLLRTAHIRAGVLAPLLEQLHATDLELRYHAAQLLVALQ